ncbi:Class I SAM-dependent methyltransferase [Candidatus Megaera venefica]|uniref:Class I SAM-dependent methyltransferase n=1 Tax=Candidatus Megaera venefica TaxID=2055910 RepID=A0ABU5NF36_9RICK|nr:class I SAM-dependent methyltransferase [Candidatus Megaera venefica]MEA0971753.1 Class I SAM-dependent methyltransferase [Candidatus Megaera venefica]
MKIITEAFSRYNPLKYVQATQIQRRFHSTSSDLVSENIKNHKTNLKTEHISAPYSALCTEYYQLDKPHAPKDALICYLNYADEAKGPILEPMCGTGRFLIPLLKKGYNITGFDSSPHMLDICRKKCQQEGLSSTLLDASFENFASSFSYKLIFIPSGSFCLLTEKAEVHQALNTILKCLEKGGKFVFEIDTLKSVNENQGVWNKSSVSKPDGAKIVMNNLSRFDSNSRVQSTLSRYELWENDTIQKTEVENFHLKLYDMLEMEDLLKQYRLTVINKYLPYTKERPDDKADAVLYECIKW